MKIAILHNFLDNIGGAEVVALTMAQELNADLFTTNIDREKIKKMGFEGVRVHSIGWVPTNAPFRQQMTLSHFHRFKLGQEYDFCIVGGDWAISGAVNHQPNLWYAFSPIREIYDLYEYTREYTVPWYVRGVYDGWVKYNRYLNKKHVHAAQKIACISKTTNNRITKYLNRESKIIYPPVNVEKYSYKKNGDFWLSVNRLITHKRVDMQLEAFSQLSNEKLIIVGSYEQSRHFKRYANYIEKSKPENVEIRSWVDNEELIELYANCKGFITTSMKEDYGLTVVEAMASGKPVIAPNEGGYQETVIHNKTGKLIDDINSNKIIESIKELGKNPSSYKEACIEQAKKFDTSQFINQLKEMINNE